MKIDKILQAASVIPVLEIGAVETAVPLVRALAAGGLQVIEATLRTAVAVDAVKAMKDEQPDLIIGMGTILSEEDIEKSLSCQPDFLVTPGATKSLLQSLKKCGIPSLPGVASASEAMTAAEEGFMAQKFFPAESAGGTTYLKALKGPLPKITFCPTGGISAEKAPEYLALSNVACVGGSWIATKDMIEEQKWALIEANAHRAAGMLLTN
ncbi:MAG: bifunctional 4-hydroxy-2-oxoglutarate aldolase/2-dehydro-3-deoxy-phosphogluconate aldolase [Aquisalinus sp.]|nr:bifunctional 4-hydroxy-2-oxoglutarate aldolase/2-dehydro-3-deoxy-phosphogluconate aldolase [Aquisalinus sp.]